MYLVQMTTKDKQKLKDVTRYVTRLYKGAKPGTSFSMAYGLVLLNISETLYDKTRKEMGLV